MKLIDLSAIFLILCALLPLINISKDSPNAAADTGGPKEIELFELSLPLGFQYLTALSKAPALIMEHEDPSKRGHEIAHHPHLSSEQRRFNKKKRLGKFFFMLCLATGKHLLQSNPVKTACHPHLSFEQRRCNKKKRLGKFLFMLCLATGKH